MGPATTALLAGFELTKVDRLADGDSHQELPQVVAVVELGETSGGDAAAEAIEGAKGHVFLIGRASLDAVQMGMSKVHETLEVRLPEAPGGLAVALLELRNPAADGQLLLHAV